MEDLENLAEKHDIKQKLYHGDGIHKIYKTLGESRITRWLSKNSDAELDGKALWKSLQTFLEKEINVQQQKQRILGKTDISSEIVESKDRRNESGRIKGRHFPTKSFNEDQNGQQQCYFCGGFDGHVETLGPGFSKVIQYFTRKRFADMTPSQCFAELKMKGYCHECLLPGASSGDDKHKKGRCQRDFICKHSIHQKYLCKKHVLFCEDHKGDEENKKTLEDYKKRCILKGKEARTSKLLKRNKVILPRY